MREKELIVYRTLQDGELLYDMSWLMEHYEEAGSGRETSSGRLCTMDAMRELLYDCIHRLIELAGTYGFHGNLWHCYLANLLVNNENSYSCGCEIRGEIKGSINAAVLHDIVIFKEFYDYDFQPMCEWLHVAEFSLVEDFEGVQYAEEPAGGLAEDPDGSFTELGCGEDVEKGRENRDGEGSLAEDGEKGRTESRNGVTWVKPVKSQGVSKVYNTRICRRICELAEKFCQDHTPEEMKATLTQFYKEYGVGRFGLHKAFRVVRKRPDECGIPGMEQTYYAHGGQGVCIVPIRNIAHVSLNDLVGYELAKRKLTDNTDAFVEGRKANNCLLFGDAGTGKSSCIKAIANEYYDKGLRLIEVYKHQFQDLNEVISQIKNRNYKFIIYMDDLSFEEFETEYKYLKAVIEGGLEKKPDNVLIYATSNRRHLIRENYSDKEEIRQDMHTGDTVQEKLSLVYRFGVTIYFGAPDKKQFQGIVKALAEKNGVNMPEEELLAEANKWELSHGGLSGRTAQQFIDYLLGAARAEGKNSP